MTALCELAAKHGTDKAGWYTPFYSLLFEPRRAEIKKVLEVGIGTKEAMAHVPDYVPGASLRMWHEYFPFALIYGADIQPTEVFEYLVPPTLADPAGIALRTICCDSRDPALPKKVGSDFDLIVDDGAHEWNVQLLTFQNLFPCLRDGGIYIIEDAEFWLQLLPHLEGYSPQVVLCPHGPLRDGAMGKLIVIRK